jgi:hypothetical protein
MDSGDYYAIVRDCIEKHGQFVQRVTGDDETPPFVYSIGNHEQGFPEILIIGNSSVHFASIVNDLGKIQRDRGRAFGDGEMVDLGGTFPAKMIAVPDVAKELFAYQACQYTGTKDFELRQAVLCDPKGRYPGDADCEAGYMMQTAYIRAGMQ